MNVVYGNGRWICMHVGRGGVGGTGRSGHKEEEANREQVKEEVMDECRPIALHSLSLPGIVTPVSC